MPHYIDDPQDLAKYVLFLKVPQLIYMFIITFTMLKIDGKLFWAVNFVSLIP